MARRGEVATGVTWGEISGPLAGIARFPRVRLGHAPTPLDAAPNLGAALGVKLWIKRDDCTGLAFGGNKVRQLEFELGEAQARGADTVLVTGAVQSNLVRLTASGARRLGMEAHVQLEDRVEGDGELYRTSGNLLLNRMLGATLHAFPVGEDEAAADAALERLAEKLAAEGRRPYVIHSAPGHPPLGGLGYVVAAGEVMEQARARGIGFDAVVCASGSALTHAGTLVGMRALGERAPVYGICVRREARAQGARVAKLAAELAAMIGRPPAFEAADVEVDDGVLPPGYGRLNDAVREAMAMAAHHGSTAPRPGLHRQNHGGSHRRGKPGALHPHRRPAGALRLCRAARALALEGAADLTLRQRRRAVSGRPGARGVRKGRTGWRAGRLPRGTTVARGRPG